MSGGTLVITRRTSGRLPATDIRDERVTAYALVPAMLDVFLERMEHAVLPILSPLL